MWRKTIETTVPSESTYFNITRSFNGALWFPSPGTLVTLPGYSNLIDHMYSENTGRKQEMHRCTHYRVTKQLFKGWWENRRFWYNVLNHAIPNPGYWTVSRETVDAMWSAYGGADPTPLSTYGTWDGPISDLPTLASVLLGQPDGVTLNLVSSVDRNLLLQQALTAMLPGIKARLSLPNTLFELKDMKTIARSLRRIKSAVEVFDRPLLYKVLSIRTLKELASIRKGSPLRTILRGVADSYLQNAFNLQPLLKDITGVRDSLRSLKRDLEGLRRRANSTQIRHFSRDLVQYGDRLDNRNFDLNTANCVTTMNVVRRVSHPVRRFSATIRYQYELPAYSDLEFSVRGLLDGLGVNLNPSIIWNAIPWSFVVDWVVGVSRWLEQFQSRNIEPIVHVSGFCHSIHVKRKIETYATQENTSGQVLSLIEDAYERFVGLDQATWTSSIQLSGMNPKELVLSAALALSR